MRRLLAGQHVAAALAVDCRLRRQMLGCGQVELAVQDRIARGILVHVGGAVADPLPRHEDRQLHVIFDLAHLERRGVPVPHQVADQAGILGYAARAAAVATPAPPARSPHRRPCSRSPGRSRDPAPAAPGTAWPPARRRWDARSASAGRGRRRSRLPAVRSGASATPSGVRQRAGWEYASRVSARSRLACQRSCAICMRSQISGAVAAQLAEPYRHLWRDRRALGQDGMQGLTRNPELLRGGLHSQPQRRQHVLPQQARRMAGPPGGGALT